MPIPPDVVFVYFTAAELDLMIECIDLASNEYSLGCDEAPLRERLTACRKLLDTTPPK
jgi:hypothetical protein